MTMRPFTDNRGGLNHLVDSQIGRAFPVVHKVYQHLDAIEYVAQVYESGRSRDIVLRTNTTKEWVEWQYKGDTKWTVLYRFSDLLGGNIADLIQAERELSAELNALRTKLGQDVEDISPMVAEVRATHGAVLAAKNEALAAQSSVAANVAAAERAAASAVSEGAQAAKQSATQAAASQQAAAESALSASNDAVVAANERALAESAAAASAESSTAAANSATAAAASATTALNAQATAVDAKNFAEEFADNAGDSATLAAAASTTATNSALLAQSHADRAEAAATDATTVVTDTFRLSKLFEEISNDPAAQAIAQQNLGLGQTDLLAAYQAAKA